MKELAKQAIGDIPSGLEVIDEGKTFADGTKAFCLKSSKGIIAYTVPEPVAMFFAACTPQKILEDDAISALKSTDVGFDFPLIIREVRKSMGENQTQFAVRFNTHANTVSRWETGQYQAPYEVISFVLLRKFGQITCPVCSGTGCLG